MIGDIIQREELNFKTIDITPSDMSTKKKTTFIDCNKLSLAVLNNCGSFFASRLEESDMDEYEKEDNNLAIIEFKNINNIPFYKNWNYQLPEEEVRS
jgi:hypothetical protein